MKLKIAISFILTLALAASVCAPAAVNDPFDKGLALFNAGDWAGSATALLAAAQQNPGDVTIRVTAGVALANVRRYPEALEQFKAAAQMSPNGILPQLLFDGVYSAMGRTDEARQIRYNVTKILSTGYAFDTATSSNRILESSLKKHPRNAIAHCLLGDIYQLQGKLTPAKEQYAEASILSPTWAKPVFNLGLAELNANPKVAEEKFHAALKLDPTNSQAHMWLGDAYLRQKKYTEAINEYKIAEKNTALATEARTRMGNAQMQAGNYMEASDQFQRVAAASPQDPRAYVGQAQIQANNGQLVDAQTNLNKAAVVMQSNSAPPSSQAVVQNQLGVNNAKMGKYADATGNFKAAFDLHPTAQNASALVDAQQKANVLSSSIDTYQQLLQKEPKNTRAMLYLLYAYKVMGDANGQLNIAKRLLKHDPSHNRTYYAEAGSAQMRLGDQREALNSYKAAIQAGDALTWNETAQSAAQCGALPSLTQYYETSFKTVGNVRTGKILLELQSAAHNTQGMVNTAERLVKLDPSNPTLWLWLGQAYEEAGNLADAAAAYNKAASSSDPDASALAKSRLRSMKTK